MKKLITIIVLMLMLGFAWATTYDKSVPPDTGEQPSQGAERIRNLAAANQEISNVDHFWPLNGSAVDDSDRGLHRQVEFQVQISTPTIAADQGMLYMKDADGGAGAKTELFWQGEDDYALQMTELNTAGNAAALNITGTYENEVSFSNTLNEFYGDGFICTDGGILTLPLDSTDTTEGNLRYIDAEDELQYRTATIWKLLAASPTAAMLKVGTYTGDDGTTKAITGVGFQPDIVIVFPMGDDTKEVCVRTTGMASTECKACGSATVLSDSVRSLDADGFTVGDGTGNLAIGDMTTSGESYFYIAAASIDNP